MTKAEKHIKITENIKKAVENGRFNDHVEIYDPVLSKEERCALVRNYIVKRSTLSYRIKNVSARILGNLLTSVIARDTDIIGNAEINGGFIVTCNHCSPTDNTAVRKVLGQMGKKRVNIVCEATNLAMTGLFGYLMNYADTVPITDDLHYMSGDFYNTLKELTASGEAVLIYPERAMWRNYRKPRPMMEGAYYYASKLNIPILSLFIEITDVGVGKSKNRIHVLGVLTPNPHKTVRENCRRMLDEDTELKKSAYEKCYGKPLDYTFSVSDIGGML